tara:strand:+ start:91 stop:648 length:558 start_codon:yes stop_codon:yes gene_type:complete
MFNHLLYHITLADTLVSMPSMQFYLFFLFLFFGYFSYFFFSNDKHSITYNYINTIIGLIFTFDFTIFFILNYELIIFAIFHYFYDPIYYIFSSMNPNVQANYIPVAFLKMSGIQEGPIPYFILIVYAISIGLFFSALHYMVFAYVNIILVFFKKKSFSDLTNHKTWYDWNDFLEDFEKEFGKKNE